MIVKDLIMKHRWEDIKSTYEDNFPDFILDREDSNKFLELYTKLQNTNIISLPYHTYIELIDVEEVMFECSRKDVIFYLNGMPKLACEGYTEVMGKKEESAIMYLNHGDFLGLEISKDTLLNYSEAEIVAACIDTIVMFGFEDGDAERALEGMTGKVQHGFLMYNN
jgi:hypothetical protein